MTYRFGVFEFTPGSGELRKNGRAVAIEPQPAKALGLLLVHAGEIVTRAELRYALWGGETHVDFDRGLAYCLSQIRSALGDSGDNPRFVQTLPKRGYKFIAPVVVSTGSSDAAGSPGQNHSKPPDLPDLPNLSNLSNPSNRPHIWQLAGMAVALAALALGWAASRHSPGGNGRVVVAVSIFDNETGMAEHDRLVAGLSDLVVTRLTGLDARLAVVGNAAVLRQPRNIRNLDAVATGVKADYVLLGQLQRGEDGFRFITHVIRLSDEAHLKANRLQMPDGTVTGLERAVVAEFERAVVEHVLKAAG